MRKIQKLTIAYLNLSKINENDFKIVLTCPISMGLQHILRAMYHCVNINFGIS